MSIMKTTKRATLSVVAFMLTMISVATAQEPLHLLSNEKNTIEIFKQAAPLVVNVHNLRRVMARSMDIYTVRAGYGSGFLWNKDGYVITNYHVIHKANRIAITFGQGRTEQAKVIGVDPLRDIAVLKLNSLEGFNGLENFKQIPLANFQQLQVGQKTIAIGNPFGLDRTLTTGIISALGRSIPGIGGIKLRNLIQTDASINPGNSGGPLLNSQGKLIGMNTLIYSSSGSSAGIGFAIPVNDIRRSVTQIIQHGKVKQPGIGVHVLPDQTAQSFGVKGVIIGAVMDNSPADRAGLQGTWRDTNGEVHMGDVIVGIDDMPVNNYDELLEILTTLNVGDKIRLRYVRDNKEHQVTITTEPLS